MNDVLPAEIGAWQYFETCTRELLASYGYEEIRVPIVEHTELFKRAIGEYTDVVGKEMYTFTDRGGDSLTLRPEATAGIVRALISNGLLRGQRHKLWCLGPMFRHESPAGGTLPAVLAGRRGGGGLRWPGCGCGAHRPERAPVAAAGDRADLSCRSIRSARPRAAVHTATRLVDYFRAHESQLDADSRRRLSGNPLRILDSKNPQMQELIARRAAADRAPRS